ncbi:hypothetical protein G3A49_18030 [Haloferax volcanii]|uniref:Uncharacterized protein n=1 Tax=Haloferax volcanii TaxID=2246 RepID=A0A6C0UXK6_HALVO|nr:MULTISPECIES: hypothetical protein [Haloferax]NLV02947.1 hypothetical protein [Haloferax alexandrinus]QIB79890.1 hypothetical protein G3A49_18030 [Haloferax alexandrinus]TVT90580.1 hypothetical protein FQA18_17920 [Haloferax volcanii]WEL27408.1 hypothetical protein SVXHx_3200 [Haloferax lucentense]
MRELLTKIRNEADQELQHPLPGVILVGLAAGLGVLLMGNLAKSVLGGSSIVADFAAIMGAGFYAAVAYYALAKLGL